MNNNKQLETDLETEEWLNSLEWVIKHGGNKRTLNLLRQLQTHAQNKGVEFPFTANTPYINTIPIEKQPPFPGNRNLERRIKSIVRWNAMAMVVRANKLSDVGGHISTYASSATLFEIGFNHFFKGKSDDYDGDLVYFQGHASPGIYARAFVEGRLSKEKLENFRRELKSGGGLSSYPHPWLMPDFWQFPTVSMGLGPICAIYQARFMRYLEDRSLKSHRNGRVWAFLGDGETDEPESLGAITLASREKLDNLIFVINCNLQRLDGPVRGNGKIIQELESVFRGAGWNVIKVIWGDDWDPLLKHEDANKLIERMDEVVDGQYQKYTVESGEYIRDHFFGKHPDLLKMVEHLTDQQIQHMRRGGHDPEKVYAAYNAAVEHTGSPTVILAKTIKGYGLGEAGEGKNITHQQKKLNEEELSRFRTRFGIPISDEDVAQAPFYVPPENSEEIKYIHKRRSALNGYLPNRQTRTKPLAVPAEKLFNEFNGGTGEREISTTFAFVRILSKLLKDDKIGNLIVPIIPDEARTFGMEALFRQFGIYSHVGQLYKPVDSDQLLYYKEAADGQIFEEGITEAGSMSTFIAAGTAYANHGVNTIPFFIYYSMFGFQRIGDLVWAAADSRSRGFMLGGTAGRTTLNGEGLQHQDGHSHILFTVVPSVITYDPAFAYELGIIIRDGIKRMYHEQQSIFYYITVGNEPYPMPAMPNNSAEGIIKGIYKFKTSNLKKSEHKAHLFGSGSIMNLVLEAQTVLEEKYKVSADVWSVTSYNELRRDAQEVQRWNMLNPRKTKKKPFISAALEQESGVFVAASDYMKILPNSIAQWIPGTYVSLGTDGFGRSETREALRDHFEIDARYIVLATLTALMDEGKIKPVAVGKAIKDLKINPAKLNPLTT